MSSLIAWFGDHLNYWTITLLMTLESTVVPVPSELVVAPAAYKAADDGELNVILIVLFALPEQLVLLRTKVLLHSADSHSAQVELAACFPDVYPLYLY